MDLVILYLFIYVVGIIIFYLIIKSAVKNGINESKLFINNDNQKIDNDRTSSEPKKIETDDEYFERLNKLNKDA